jgi:hypothetical protein
MRPLCALAVSILLVCLAGCTLFGPPLQTHPASLQGAPVTRRRLTIRSAPLRAAPASASQPPLNLPQPPSPPPVVTLQNSDDAKANAQRLLQQASVKLAHVNQAELADNTVSTYRQANELINAAQRAMAERDYPAASSLAEKASALTSQLPLQASH